MMSQYQPLRNNMTKIDLLSVSEHAKKKNVEED